jgi:hypothetical protein
MSGRTPTATVMPDIGLAWIIDVLAMKARTTDSAALSRHARRPVLAPALQLYATPV